ncbi:MAG: hypothetical protein HYT83_03520 [Candidatus Levybacteria bacterium]|nr:hypothetical protein [Candidatus Levybacteria bacterium]
MTTTYILDGRETSRDNPDNAFLFKYFTHFVAKDKKIWNQRLETDRNRIEAQTTKKISLSLAKDPEDLLKKKT